MHFLRLDFGVKVCTIIRLIFPLEHRTAWTVCPCLNPPSSLIPSLLARKLRQPPLHILPRLLAIYNRFNGLTDLILARPNLLRRISISQRHGVILDGLEVNGHTKWCTEFVVASIPLADAGAGVVNAVGDAHAAQLLREAGRRGAEGGVV